MKDYGFGVDIGGTTVKMGLFTTEGELLDKWEIPTRKEDDGARILPDVAASIGRVMKVRCITAEDVLGIGIGVPGPVNAEGVVNHCVNLGWGVLDVRTTLQELTGLSVAVGNDANVAALGEMWQGGGRGCSNVLLVTLGTGVGGGVIVDGHIVAGAHGAAGEIGHIMVNPHETHLCNCGRRGCLEQYASATGIANLAKRRLAELEAENSKSHTLADGAEVAASVTVLKECADLTAKDVFDAAKAGDAIAMGIVEDVAEILGTALANVACVSDPEVIVLGGGVSKAGSILTDAVQKYFEPAAFPACRGTRFALASLGNDAGIYGCMKMIMG